MFLLYFHTELRQLPSLPAESRLKKLRAEECAIESLPPSFLRRGVMINLSGNPIKELPRRETQAFLESGGKFESRSNSEEVIILNNVPLEYPPRSIFDEGKEAILRYLRDHPAPGEDDEISANQAQPGDPAPGTETDCFWQAVDPLVCPSI